MVCVSVVSVFHRLWRWLKRRRRRFTVSERNEDRKMAGGRFQAFINPLAFLEVDEPWASIENKPPTAETILSFLCPPGMPADAKSIVGRYQQISTEAVRLFAAPAEPRILEKLVWPLRHAKASYVLGNNLAVVALCGMVAEMVALLMWQLAEPNLNGRPMTPQDETKLFGSSFEKLSQDRRVRVLSAYSAVPPAVEPMFETIRLRRRKYLHLWSQDHERLSQDAVDCFHAAVGLVVAVIGQDIKDGVLILNPRLVKYLKRQGVYEPPPETAS
jgi:hypothetical protein